jgi:hypothetical protein
MVFGRSSVCAPAAKIAKAVSFAAVLLMTVWLQGCGNSPTTPTDLPEFVTEVFQGTLTAGGQEIHVFAVTQQGTVTIILQNAFQAASGVQVSLGMAVGEWDRDSETCTLIAKNDEATFNTLFSASALARDYCATVYDVGSFGVNPVQYTMEVRHL